MYLWMKNYKLCNKYFNILETKKKKFRGKKNSNLFLINIFFSTMFTGFWETSKNSPFAGASNTVATPAQPSKQRQLVPGRNIVAAATPGWSLLVV